MPRRCRGFGPQGACCHITQRCINREFLLKFKCDRRNYVRRLQQGLSRHAPLLLDYVVTSNHSHILVWARRAAQVTQLMQYVGGCTAQDYNRRKKRSGAYWGERYRVTLIQSGSHLSRCLFYIDMNMVRAGVVDHPQDWETGGCRELMREHRGTGLVAWDTLLRLVACQDRDQFRAWHRRTLQELCDRSEHPREPWWSEAAAVGDRDWIAPLADRFAVGARRVRQIRTEDGAEFWSLGMSRRLREGFLRTFD